MKAYRLSLAIALALFASVVFVIVPDPAFAAGLIQDHALGGLGSHLIEATVALAALRTKHGDLVKKATDKRAEIKDGMADTDVRRIEGEHETLVREAEAVQRQIDDAEAEERSRSQNTPPAGESDAVRQAREAATAEERARVAELQVIARQGGVDAETLQKHIADGTKVEAFRKIVLDLVAARSQEGAGTGVRATITRDETETRRSAMAGAIAARLARAGGDRNAQLPEASRAYAEMGFVEMAAEVIGYRGNLRTVQQVDGVFARAFLTTSDFPAILMDAMSRRLMARYVTMTPTYQLFCGRYVNPDFRATNVLRAGDFPKLQPVGQTGEIKSGAFSESKEQLTVSPYAVMMNLSRQMIINDQLNAIDQVLGSAGESVRSWESDMVYAKIAEGSGAGPLLLTDNKRVFHTDHGNLAGTPSIIDVGNVGLGRAAMMKQKTLDGIPAGFYPEILLFGPDKINQAEQLLTAITAATNATAVPAAVKDLTPVCDPRIAGNAWYLFASGTRAPCFLYGYLEGYEGPRMTSQEHFGVQGLSVKLEHDFGVAGVDFRGGYRNAGA